MTAVPLTGSANRVTNGVGYRQKMETKQMQRNGFLQYILSWKSGHKSQYLFTLSQSQLASSRITFTGFEGGFTKFVNL